jgi:hypothetical protein
MINLGFFYLIAFKFIAFTRGSGSSNFCVFLREGVGYSGASLMSIYSEIELFSSSES